MVYDGEETIEAIEETWSFVLATLRDRQQMDQIRQVTKRCLESIIKTMFPCRIKLLCPQFGLLPRLTPRAPSVHLLQISNTVSWLPL